MKEQEAYLGSSAVLVVPVDIVYSLFLIRIVDIVYSSSIPYSDSRDWQIESISMLE